MKALYFLTLILFTHLSFGQQLGHFAQSVADSLDEKAIHKPAESVYIQTDKQVYESGEDLWFAVNVLNSQLLAPSSLSNILYVELRSDSKDKSIYKELFPLENGFTDGHLYLPDTLPTGHYWVTAFTANSVKNQEAELKSVRKIMVKQEVVPHILIQGKFEQEQYVSGQEINLTVRLMTPGGSPVIDTKTIVDLKNGRRTLERFRMKSDASGYLAIKMKSTADPAKLTVRVRVDDPEHDEYFDMQVPVDTQRDIQLSLLPEGGNLVSGLVNVVAFKAVDPSGLPYKVEKGVLLENDKEILEFSSEHAGMGRFSFYTQPGKTYSVKLIEPRVDSTYVLPEIYSEGLGFHLRANQTNQLTFAISKTANVQVDSVLLLVKQRGAVAWAGTAEVKGHGTLMSVPVTELPSGIVEATLYSDQLEPIAERLVYVNHHKKLNIQAVLNQSQYGVKEKVELKLKVSDEQGNPVQSMFTLTAVDELFESNVVDRSIQSYYLLENELRGAIFEPGYYFDNDNPHAVRHLDLLMMTQGWRAYEWDLENLVEQSTLAPAGAVDFVEAKVVPRSISGSARRRKVNNVQIFGFFGALQVKTDSSGSFPILANLLDSSEGASLGMKIEGEEFAEFDFITAFDHTPELRSVQQMVYGHQKPMVKTTNWDKLPEYTSAVRKLDEVEVVGEKQDREAERIYGKVGGEFYGRPTDWVCHFNILNCGNHRSGRAPIPGTLYRFGAGWVKYKLPELEKPNVLNSYEGFYRKPKFYEPDYDANPLEKQIPDFRNSLVWSPNVLTDENGEVTVVFYTSDIRSVFNARIESLSNNGYFGMTKFDINVLSN